MAVVLWVLLLPLAWWVYVGAAYTIWNTLIAVVTLVVTEHMEKQVTANLDLEYPARLIRYVDTLDASQPHILSRFDAARNLQMINRPLALTLPIEMRNRLETSTIRETVVVDDGKGLRFGTWSE